MKIHRNICRKNLSTIIHRLYRYRFKKLRFIDFIGIAQSFFKIIDCRYIALVGPTQRFIVPIHVYTALHLSLFRDMIIILEKSQLGLLDLLIAFSAIDELVALFQNLEKAELKEKRFYVSSP